MPSMTGLVASFEVTKTVSSSLTDSEVDAIEDEVIANFNVSADDVITTGNHEYLFFFDGVVFSVTYSASGSMTVTAGDLTDEEVVNAIEAALIDEFNVHPSDVEVSYDSESGVVTYTITSDDAESLADVVSTMQEPEFEVTAEGVSVDSFDAPTDVVVTVDVTGNYRFYDE